jgi:autotransporter passenger strand-loop-strand repeat protein
MALSAGSIAFTGFNGDGNDNLSFVALTDIAQGTVINFTDSNWSGSSFASGSNAESTMAWTATSAIPAGTVIDINNIGGGTLGASAGSVTFTNSNNTGLSNDSEVVYAYTGSASAPTFLAAISSVGYGTSDGTLTGTGLVAGQTAVSFTGGLDIMGYNGPRSGQTSFAAYLAALNNTANWQTQNGSGNQSADGTAPDAPFPTTAFTVTAPAGQTVSFSPSSVSVTEGDSGTKTLTFTIQRSGGTTGALSFSGSFAAGTTNAADYGGTLPASTFSGTIAAGATSATVTITISGDTTGEGDESFSLTLNSATNPSASVTIGTATATGTITNDDGTVVSGNSSTAITLSNNDHVTIQAGVTLSGSTPVTWTGGSTAPGALLDNFGTVTGTSRAIYTSGSTSGSLTVHNEAGATITATKDAIKISNLGSGSSGTLTVINEGTISSTGTGDNAGQALDLDDIASANVHTVITNAATGVIQAADADAIRGGTNATINNYGQIVSHNASSSSTGNDAIDFQTVNTGGVINNYAGGVIDGARHAITGDQPITVNNSGTITGEAGSGINMDSAGTTTTIVNNAATGTITGKAVNGADADGVDVDGLVAIDNFGTIRAVGLTSAANGLNEALAIGGGTVHNEAGGLIASDQRAITVDDSNDGSAFAAIAIINDGTIQGGNGEAISITGAFADTITNRGTIAGSVSTDGGNDTFNAYVGSTVSGAIDLGDGNDTVNLYATAGNSSTGTLGVVANAETLNVVGGTWSIGGTDGYKAVDVAGGATVAGPVYLSGTETLTVEQGGSIVGSTVAVANIGISTVTIVNNGTIKLTAAPGAKFDAIVLNQTGATVHNGATGVIEGARHAITGPLGVTVVNDAGGLIVGHNGSALNMDNDASPANTAYVTNRGTMLGDSANISDSDGDAIDTDGLLQLDNYGMIRGEGANGYHKGEANVSEGIASGGGVINNYAGATIYGYGRAIQIDNSSNGAAYASTTIYNEGTIQGDGHGPTGVSTADAAAMQARIDNREAIDILGNFADTITNKGSIIGGIFTDGGNDTLTNSGSITGHVMMGAGDDTINLIGGEHISGVINGDTGNDTVNLVSGVGVLGGVINVEKLDVQGGTWTVYDVTNFSTITVEDGAELISREAADGTTVVHGGSHFVFGAVSDSTVSGKQFIEAGGTASGTLIQAGGEQDVYTSGTASGTTIAGGSQFVYGGSVDQTTIDAGGLQYLFGNATDTTINNGGEQNVYAGATAAGAIVNSGGLQLDWGTAVDTTINGGTQFVLGTASDTTIVSGVQHVQDGGVASNTTIGSGGTEFVHGGGTANSVTFAGPSAALVLDHADGFTGTISGWQDGDSIDLGDILFSANTTLAYAANEANTGGTLIVSDGSHVASLALLGQYTAADFALASDGLGGSLISDPGIANHNVLAPAMSG